ncbi:MAG: hypothetical protein HYY00_02055 [Chloroflexi bacterium]|nr:hypothetical protein [Chloroflexota bacterium]
MQSQQRGENFGPFLRGLKHSKGRSAPDEGQTKLLAVLAYEGPQRVEELRRMGGLGLPDFLKALDHMLGDGLVKLEGPRGEETVSLTPLGERAAKGER